MAGGPVPVEHPVDPSEIAGRLRLSATRLARRLRQEAGAGLTPSQLSALAVIDNHGPLTLGSLAEHERVAPPSVTKVVAKLEADGLVVRTCDPGDRRISWVSTSSRGVALVDESRRRKTAWLAGRIGTLDADQQARLDAALDVLDLLTTDGPAVARLATDGPAIGDHAADGPPTDVLTTDDHAAAGPATDGLAVAGPMPGRPGDGRP
jgi:DNA-binding MarR family transcriptional regulator